MDTAMELVQLTSHGKHSVAPTKPFQVSQTSVLQPITNQDNILRGPETDFLVELDDARIWGMDFGSAQEPYADAILTLGAEVQISAMPFLYFL